MLNSERIRRKPSIQSITNTYAYAGNVPPRGLIIDGRPAMTQIDPAKAGDFVLMTVRDPLCAYSEDPAELLAKRLEDPQLIDRSGMFTSYTGMYKGAKITIVSGGSGSAEAELALYDSNAHTYLRVGGSGGLGDHVHPGDLVIASGVVREDGMTGSYIPLAYPAVCHYEVVTAMVQAAEALGAPYHVGVTLSVASDFLGGGRPGVGGYLQPWNTATPEIYNRAGVLNGDRESAGIVTLASLFGLRGGAVCSVADNLVTGERFREGAGHTDAIAVALEACRILQQMDEKKVKSPIGIPSWDVLNKRFSLLCRRHGMNHKRKNGHGRCAMPVPFMF